MSRITKLTDIEVYSDSLNLANQIYLLGKKPEFKHEYSLLDQIKRASLSIAANIAEGYGRYSKKDFAHFLSISLGSCNEVITYLDFINLALKTDTSSLKEEYFLLSKRIYKFRTYLLKE